jgi:hypothetical protein
MLNRDRKALKIATQFLASNPASNRLGALLNRRNGSESRQGRKGKVWPGRSACVFFLSESLTFEFNEFMDFMRIPDPIGDAIAGAKNTCLATATMRCISHRRQLSPLVPTASPYSNVKVCGLAKFSP